MKIRKRVEQKADVLEAALERIRYLYRSFDSVAVSFSAGKDSTAVLALTIHVARELGKLPVRAIFFDEEAIHPPTVEYAERVRLNPDVNLEWYCLPVQHRNACSDEHPYWTCWGKEDKDKWVRPMPEHAIHSHPLFREGMSFQEFCPLIMPRNSVVLQGIRAEESLRRARMVAVKANDNYITRAGGKASAYPIYDWKSVDVWTLVREWGIDYNRTYDVFNRTKLFNKLLTQRVCPPFGEEPLRGLWVYAECWPEMWHKMLARCHGVATAWRYANSTLYLAHEKPENISWQDYAYLLLDNHTPELESRLRGVIDSAVRRHNAKTDDPVPDSEPHPLTGQSWAFIAKLVKKGDLKDRTAGTLSQRAVLAQKKAGITQEQAKKLYGKQIKTTN